MFEINNMKYIYFLSLILFFNYSFSQNVGINTTGAAPAATNLLEVLSPSTTNNSVGIYSAHSGAITGTGYAMQAIKTGASTINIAGYFSASGATSNYAIIVPSGGGNVGIGTNAPESLFEVQAEEANDATITLDADDGDDNADTWFIKSLAADNTLSFSNHATEYFKMKGPRLYIMNSGNSVFVGEDAGKNDDLSANLNTGVGYEALKANTTGFQNVAMGYQALKAETTGNSTVAVGTYTLLNQNGGGNNTAVGHDVMNACTSCGNSVAIGTWALRSNVTSWSNTAVGYSSLYQTTGANNVGLGNEALYSNKANTGSTAIGYQAMYYADDQVAGRATYNTAVGYQALRGSTTAANNTGRYNTAVGDQAMKSLTSGDENVAVGYIALNANTTGGGNIAIGKYAMGTTTTGQNNVGIGGNALEGMNGSRNVGVGTSTLNATAASAQDNVAMGYEAGYSNTGDFNVIIGRGAGRTQSSGDANILIGWKAGDNITTGDNNIIIGYDLDAQAVGNSNKLIIGNLIFGTGIDGTGTSLSSGNIGIGVAAPGEKLEVNGNVKATTFIATAAAGSNPYKYNTASNMTVPDYVFENYYDNNKKNNPEYSMMKLSDLEKYLQKNKHLPRVPSREQILKDKGVNVQAFSMISLEKIEENTLYIIELEKQIKQQQETIENLIKEQAKQKEQIEKLLEDK